VSLRTKHNRGRRNDSTAYGQAAAYGGKPVLLFAVLAWSLATALTPAAAGASVPVLVGVRVLMGVGEGVSLPAMHHLTALWCPLEERSRFVAFCNSGQCALSPRAISDCHLIFSTAQPLHTRTGFLSYSVPVFLE
jgi:MFS family permease